MDLGSLLGGGGLGGGGGGKTTSSTAQSVIGAQSVNASVATLTPWLVGGIAAVVIVIVIGVAFVMTRGR
jgi:hypothetical protein